ncbi:MAG: SDR family oxidoreductase [Pseudomonadota bacterium]
MNGPETLFCIKDKVAVVTGGTRGIGEMIATGYLKAGAKTYITSRKADACAAMQDKLGAFGRCIAAPYDLSCVEGCAGFVDFVAKREEKIDILVNNAGATWGAPLEEFPESGWDKIMDLNVKSLFFLTQKLAPMLRKAASADGRAKVINIGSADGLTVPLTENYSYSASKAAVHHMTRVFASKFVKDTINVNAIAPGPFESKMTAFMLGSEEGRESIGQMVPMGRIGAPEDMIGLSLFLAAPASDYITGAVIPLDGGYVNLR